MPQCAATSPLKGMTFKLRIVFSVKNHLKHDVCNLAAKQVRHSEKRLHMVLHNTVMYIVTETLRGVLGTKGGV